MHAMRAPECFRRTSVQRDRFNFTHQRVQVAVELLHDVEDALAPTGEAEDTLLRELERAVALHHSAMKMVEAEGLAPPCAWV